MADIELEQLHKRFGNLIALHALDLHVRSGEFVSLLGPSGCGKTTALRIVAGFENSDGGRVLVGGEDVSRVPANRRNMGMVFQSYSLFPNMTARQNVEFGLRVRHRPTSERRKRAAELLDLVGLASAMDRYPHQLSGGQQQRVALARALAIEPAVLLLDEPLSALDAKVRVQLREEIRRIQQELGITLLYVTHDQEEALAVSDRVVVLSQGRIEQVGTPAEIYGEPSTVFVAQFIGTMNVIEGTVDSEVGVVRAGSVALPSAATHGYRSNERVVLLLRPETLQPLDQAAVNGSHPALSGDVITRTFLGAVTRTYIQTPAGRIAMDTPSQTAFAFVPGSRVTVTWDPADTRVLPLDRPLAPADEPRAAVVAG